MMKQSACDAVIFDYGGVLCYAPSREDVLEFARGSGFDEATFLHLYSETREYYGRAAAGYASHWQRVAKTAGVEISETAVKAFIEKESGLWTRPNTETLALARAIKSAGGKIAILSNMTDDLLAVLRGKFDWLDEFDVRIWSCEKGCAKPDEGIYHMCLEGLGCEPQAAMFFDDRSCNVDAAGQLGIDAHLFESARQAKAAVEQRSPLK